MQNSKITKEKLERFLSQPIELQLELFKNYVEMVKLFANFLFEDEVDTKAGQRYARSSQYSRWGSNPGSIRIGEEKVRVNVPRIYDKDEQTAQNVDIYTKLREISQPSEEILKKLAIGISQNDYKRVSQHLTDSFGLSQSTLSKTFIEGSDKILKEFQSRDLSKYDFVALVIDGKYLAKDQIVIALGVTIEGDKIPLEFIQSTTENAESISGLLKKLINRNFSFSQGLLVICDGSKGIKKAVSKVFGSLALIQRCQWHKRENVVSYLREEDKAQMRSKLQRAYREPNYEIAKSKLLEIRDELLQINHTAAKSLEEGLEETLTIHRLGLVEELGRSLTTTNTIENLNSQLEKYLRRVRYWQNGDMKSRWVAVALCEIEHRMRKISNHKKLNLLRSAIQSELKLHQRKVA